MVLSMDKWKGKVAVVTGASSGIGEGIVKKLVEEGLVVVGLARRLERMQKQQQMLVHQPGKFHPVQCDIGKETDILRCFDYIKENIGPVHILVNNAGCCISGTLSESDTNSWKTIMDVNVIGLCVATREAVKVMKSKNIEGHIINMNSLAGHFRVQVSGLNLYPASKHAVTSISDTLKNEFATSKTKIKVTSISPGVVDTEIFAVSGLNEFHKAVEENSVPSLSPDDIADAVCYVLSTPPIVNVSEMIIQPVNETI
ncbi:unnamed protein product [Phyllotreta striolata]|uniref:Farnesol dehydrogenase-like n=1 Tax=Phyllotreta striolata TaxID=444603 RepID=A0A9N9XRS6_PHYSR|nr:unnamed protein product [Phyllotreta striolata]